MTFILILSPSSGQHWPAIVGGYLTREDADAAGQEAIMAHLTEQGFEDAGYGMGADREMWRRWRDRPWASYTVIPASGVLVSSQIPQTALTNSQ